MTVPATNPIPLEAITNQGERVVHLRADNGFHAHLSIYRFALAYAQGKRVLDAGSGTGYGAAYLAERGAAFVLGMDVSKSAVGFSQEHFQADNLAYLVMDLHRLGGLGGRSFDFIFSSNTLEHLTDVDAFLRESCRILKQDGTALIAVPPVHNEASLQANLANPYHLTIWTPEQWYSQLCQYYQHVTCIRHHVETAGVPLDFSNDDLNEADFLFLPSTVAELDEIGALTAIFVAQSPRPLHLLPQPGGPPATVPGHTNTDRLGRRAKKALTLLHEGGPLALLHEIRSFLRYHINRLRPP